MLTDLQRIRNEMRVLENELETKRQRRLKRG